MAFPPTHPHQHQDETPEIPASTLPSSPTDDAVVATHPGDSLEMPHDAVDVTDPGEAIETPEGTVAVTHPDDLIETTPATDEDPDAWLHQRIEDDPLYEGEPVPVYDPEAAQRAAEEKRRRARRLGVELVQTLVLASLIFFAVRTMAQNFKVEGSSMEPGLHNGQYLLVNKAVYFQVNMKTIAKFIPFIHVGDNPQHYLFHGPHRGDVIVFRYPNDPSRDFIKRVIGTPGDTVEIVHGVLMINGQAVKEDFLPPGTFDMTTEKKTVPAGQYYVLGDNRNNSSDSRAWGFVPAENIIGQAMFSYWPLDNLGGVGNRHLSIGLFDIPLPSFSLPSVSLPFS